MLGFFPNCKEISATLDMARRRSAYFFKILLDASAPYLPLPSDFVSRHLKNKIPKDPVIRSATGGYSWRLKIKKVGESYCFSNGWDDVVRDIQLGFGDLLTFKFDDNKSIFKMFVFSPNGCGKDIPPKIDEDSDTIDDVIVEDVDEEAKDDEEEDEIEAEDEYDDDDEEEEEEYVEEKDDGDDDDGDDGDDDGGGDIDGNDGDPFFMSIISKTHQTMMRLPSEFVELAGINGERSLTMRNLDGKEWETKLRLEKSNHQSDRYCVSAGWPGFWRGNDLCEGDECVFKFIRSEDTLLLAKVTKKKRPARQPQPQPSGEAPATEVVKRKRGQPQPQPQPSVDTPATEVVKRKRGQPQPQPSVDTPAAEVVKRKRGRPQRNSGEVPAAKVEKRGRRRAACEEERVEVVKKSRGKPAKRRRGKPARQK